MGRTASSSPSQQSTSTTRCRTQTVDSPFGNSSNPIFTEAHQAATFIVVRHYPHTNQAFSVHTYPELALLGRPFRIGVFSSRREEVEGGKGTEGERRHAGGVVAIDKREREGGGRKGKPLRSVNVLRKRRRLTLRQRRKRQRGLLQKRRRKKLVLKPKGRQRRSALPQKSRRKERNVTRTDNLSLSRRTERQHSER